MHPAALRLTALAATLVAAAPAVADACSCRTQERGRFFLGAGGLLPPDAVGIPWDGPDLAPLKAGDLPRVTTFERHDGAYRTPVRFTLKREGALEFIVPEGGLRPGDRFTITVLADRAGSVSTTATVTVGPAPIALDGATLVLSKRRRGTVALRPEFSRGQCSDDVEADIVQATVALPPALEPYREYLLYTTLVDGQPYRTAPSSLCAQRGPPRGRSQRGGPGADVLFTTCDGAAGLAPGVHTVAIQLATPDGRSFSAPAQPFELDCATSPPPEPPPPVRPPEPAPTPAPSSAPAGPPPVARGCTLAPPATSWPLVLLLLALRRRTSRPRRSRGRALAQDGASEGVAGRVARERSP